MPLDPCPYCGAKATIEHLECSWQGFDLGWMAGCPRFAINDKIHQLSDKDRYFFPSVQGYFKDEVEQKWNEKADMLRRRLRWDDWRKREETHDPNRTDL